MAGKIKKNQIKINFTPVRQQSTHWYATESGWTSQPMMASREEVQRRGFHDCEEAGCKEAHAGSAEEYWFFQKHGKLPQEAIREEVGKEAKSTGKAKRRQRTVRGKKLEGR